MAGLKGRAKARSRASGRDEAEKRGEGFLFHVIAPWRATVGESCVKAPIRRRLHGSEPDRGFCTGSARGVDLQALKCRVPRTHEARRWAGFAARHRAIRAG